MPWAMVVTAPNSEHIVSRELRDRHGIPHHYFKRMTTRVHRGRVIDKLLPAFPRYIFVPPEHGYQLKYENSSRDRCCALADRWNVMDGRVF